MKTVQLQAELKARGLCSKFILIVLLVSFNNIKFYSLNRESTLSNQPLMRLYTKDYVARNGKTDLLPQLYACMSTLNFLVHAVCIVKTQDT